MENGRELKDSLNVALATISNCDNKAVALMTAVGVIFGFSMFSIEQLTSKSQDIQIAIYIVGIAYLVSFVTTIILLVLIILPRRRIKKEKMTKIEYPLYPEDLFSHFKSGDIEAFIIKDSGDDAIIEQIKSCTRIAHVKENLLRASTFTIIPFAVQLFTLVIFMFC